LFVACLVLAILSSVLPDDNAWAIFSNIIKSIASYAGLSGLLLGAYWSYIVYKRTTELKPTTESTAFVFISALAGQTAETLRDNAKNAHELLKDVTLENGANCLVFDLNVFLGDRFNNGKRIESIEGAHMPDVLYLLRELRKQISIMNCINIVLYYGGPGAVAIQLGSVLSNTPKVIKLIQITQQNYYDFGELKAG
jgi:hypothetical protein